jgi:hypothetical protein
LLPETAARRDAAKHAASRSLALTDTAFERGGAAEPAIGACAQHGEDAGPRDQPGGEAVEFAAEPDAAEHCGGEHQHDDGERRAMFVFDMSAAASAQAHLVAAERICANGLRHFVLQTVINLCFHKLTQLERSVIPDNS